MTSKRRGNNPMFNKKPVSPGNAEDFARLMGVIAFGQYMIQRMTYGDLFEDDGATVCLN